MPNRCLIYKLLINGPLINIALINTFLITRYLTNRTMINKGLIKRLLINKCLQKAGTISTLRRETCIASNCPYCHRKTGNRQANGQKESPLDGNRFAQLLGVVLKHFILGAEDGHFLIIENAFPAGHYSGSHTVAHQVDRGPAHIQEVIDA